MADKATPIDLSVLILTRNERENLGFLVGRVRDIVDDLRLEAEFVIVDDSVDGTSDVARALGCKVVAQEGRGYGNAFRQGLAATQGEFTLAIDADHSHEPKFLYDMWSLRDSADLVIGSRYVPGGSAEMPASRRVLSKILNVVFARVLTLPLRDLSSGYRLYRRAVIDAVMPLRGRDFDILEEILVKAYCEGFRIREVPIHYRPRNQGRSNAKAVKFAFSYLRTHGSMWRLRNAGTRVRIPDENGRGRA
jgi:dolichol-phosphate mannosyltransferase